MRLRFGPDDEDGYVGAREELLARFERWLAERGRSEGLVAHAETMLYFKWGYSDGDLGWWVEGHLDRLLLEHYPREVVAEPDLIDDTIPAIQAFLDFLDDEELLSERSARPEALTQALERLRVPFRRAMGDRSKWGPGKSLVGGMADDGGTPRVRDATDAWGDEFTARPFVDRDRMLGPVMTQVARLVDDFQNFRPVVLPPREEVEAAARATPGLRRVAGLVAYVEQERQLTDRGNLKLADARQLVEALDTGDEMDETFGDRTFKTRSSTELETLDLTFRIARQAGFVKVRKGRVSATQAGRDIDRDPLAAHSRAFDALLEVGVLTHRYAENPYGFAWFAHDVDAAVVDWLLDWYDDGSEFIDTRVSRTWRHLNELYDLSGMEPDMVGMHQTFVEHGVRRILKRLSEFGVISVEDVTEVPTGYGTTEEHGGHVDVTELGVWVIHRMASAYAFAPVVGQHVDADAAALLDHCATDLPPYVAAAEIDAWVAAREPAAAAAALAEGLRTARQDARSLGFAALRRLGEDAVVALRRLAADDELAPFVTACRIDLGDLEPSDVATDDARGQLDLLHAALVLWDFRVLPRWLELVVGADGKTMEGQQRIAAAVEELWRVRSDAAVEVLEALAARHGDKRIAKAARKASFKLRSAGIG